MNNINYWHSNIVIYAMKAPSDIQCFHSCLIHDQRSRQLKAERGWKSELKDESRKAVWKSCMQRKHWRMWWLWSFCHEVWGFQFEGGKLVHLANYYPVQGSKGHCTCSTFSGKFLVCWAFFGVHVIEHTSIKRVNL